VKDEVSEVVEVISHAIEDSVQNVEIQVVVDVGIMIIEIQEIFVVEEIVLRIMIVFLVNLGDMEENQDPQIALLLNVLVMKDLLIDVMIKLTIL
jgi:hypothetical protein